ncbi:sphingosine/diacylglycerol kinase-related protein [Syntrophotalea carbinolica DSM 2380]|uniref:Sphingosine/diacylglycerol kinase-related protein n=1 Tax=Syntrophotalea carbinolica (strain DSM 2380 / NBRC 103641 / GraBd1) TaxID=338963 RepID=Q3A7H1_SYNC1|nr:diacylglycerol kinase family protein [Syntrophotalea carbinolica]ABA87673.1 sphingosine/diacylglycerol kinase-related protein [Syntrophotalea carbinolica DSM 2380]
MKIMLIANPVAGGRARCKIDRVVTSLQARGAAVKLVLTGARGDARKAAADARDAGFDRIVAAGGDGTLNEVINGLTPSDTPLAFIPLGTTNVFALETGIPLDLEKACALVMDGEPRRVCLGQSDGEHFLLMAGIGFDAEVVRRVNLRLKRYVGKLAYLISGLASLLRYRPRPLEVTTETGMRRQAYGVIVSNCRLYGGRFVVSPGASLYADALHVCLLRSDSRLGMLRTVSKIAAGHPLLAEEVVQLKAREITVRGDRAPVQVDGDYLGELPRVFRARFGDLQMVLPVNEDAAHEC